MTKSKVKTKHSNKTNMQQLLLRASGAPQLLAVTHQPVFL